MMAFIFKYKLLAQKFLPTSGLVWVFDQPDKSSLVTGMHLMAFSISQSCDRTTLTAFHLLT